MDDVLIIRKEATESEVDQELHAAEVTVAGIVEDKEAAEALLDEMSKAEITGTPGRKAKAKAKANAKPKAMNLTPIGTPVPSSVGGEKGNGKKINMPYELNALSNRLMKLTRNTKDLRVRKSTARDEALVQDMDVLIERLVKLKEKCEAIVTSVVPPAAEVANAALEAKAALFINLKSDETFLVGRLKWLNNAVA